MNLPVINPFARSILSDPTDIPAVDVKEINQNTYNFLLNEIQKIAESGERNSTIIFGQPGTGKTHLLNRLRRSHSQSCDYHVIPVKINTPPERLWRHIRRIVVKELKGKIGNRSRLELILDRRIGSPDSENIEDKLSDIVEDSNLVGVLCNLYRGTYRNHALGWLRGDSLSEGARSSLGLPTTEEAIDGVDQEDYSKQVVLGICKLALPSVFVFCFDQIEWLIRDEKLGGLRLYGEIAADIHDGPFHAMIVSCIQSRYQPILSENIVGSNRDRVWKSEMLLKELTEQEAESLVLALLDNVPELAAKRKGGASHLFWPLDEGQIRNLIASEQNRSPRTLITECRKLYDKLIDTTKPPISCDEFLSKDFQRKIEEGLDPSNLGERDSILHDGLRHLTSILTPNVQEAQSNGDVDIAFKDGNEEIQVSFCNHENMNSLGARLRRLDKFQAEKSNDRLKSESLRLIRLNDLPIPGTAKKTRQVLSNLEDRGAKIHRISHELLSMIGALRDLLSQARAGDLSNEGETVDEKEVSSWIGSNAPSAVREFFSALFGETSVVVNLVDDELYQNLLDWIKDHRWIADLPLAAQTLDAEAALIVSLIAKNPEVLGLIEGDPPIIFARQPVSYGRRDY
ncbi:MAG: ATP-binding protein [Verrucomicrobiales bacterium]|nr:ATP-binding protein [Verrucomicrobiales bacterium]